MSFYFIFCEKKAYLNRLLLSFGLRAAQTDFRQNPGCHATQKGNLVLAVHILDECIAFGVSLSCFSLLIDCSIAWEVLKHPLMIFTLDSPSGTNHFGKVSEGGWKDAVQLQLTCLL